MKNSEKSEAEILKLVNELQVHQEMLKTQNEELRYSREETKLALDKYTELYDFAPSGYFTLSKDGIITELNLSGAKMLNIDRKLLLNKPLNEYASGNSKSAFSYFLERIFSSRSVESCEVTLKGADSSVKHVLLSGITNASGVQCRITMTEISDHKLLEEEIIRRDLLLHTTQKLAKAGGWEYNVEKKTMFWTEELYNIYDINPADMDITKSKQAEKIILESEEKFRILASLAPAGIYITNPEGSCTYTNPRWNDMAGITTEEAFGENWIKGIHPEDREKVLSNWQKMIQSRGRWGMEYRFLTPDGLTTWVYGLATPQYDDSGRIIQYIGMNMDITEFKLAQKALEESENKYRELVENSPDAIAIYYDRKIVFVNSECLRLIGAANIGELIGKPLMEFVHPDYRTFVIERMKKISTGKAVLPLVDEIFIRLDGSELDVEVKAMPVLFEGKASVQLILRDISERKQTETRLLESEERYKRIAEGLTDYLYTVVVKNGKAVKTIHNEACRQVTGYSSKEFSQDPFLWINMVVLDDRAQVASRFTKILNNNDLPQLEHRIICKNGKTKWIRDTVIPKFDIKGRLIAYDGVIKDITEQKLTEQLFNARLYLSAYAHIHSRDQFQQELLDKLESLTDSKIGFFHAVDSDQKRLKLQSWSTNTLENMCKTEGKGQHYDIEKAGVWVDCFHQRKAVIHNDYMGLSNRKGMPEGHAPVVRELAVPIFRKDQIVAIVGIGNKPLDYTKSDIEIVTLLSDMAWDIIERKISEEEILLKNAELRRVNAEKDKFFSIIAHDLRSPFNSFLGFTQMMAEELSTLSIKEVQKIAVSMRNSATNLFHLLENLLEWSRFQRGVTFFEPELVLLMPKAKECLESVIESATKKGIELSFAIPDGLVVYADANMLASILRNLAFNAVKFTNNEGKICFSAKSVPGNMVEFSIKDTGIGMNKDIIENLFQLNENSKRSGTNGEPSTGLGLIICKEFIEKNGGKIFVESKESVGSTFMFTLPSFSY